MQMPLQVSPQQLKEKESKPFHNISASIKQLAKEERGPNQIV